MRPDPFRMIVFHGSDLGGERAAFGVGDRTLNNILSAKQRRSLEAARQPGDGLGDGYGLVLGEEMASRE